MPKIVNRAYMTTATTGTGTITLGSAVGSFRSFAASGVVDGDVVRYVIEDGDNWEIGSGTYAASGTTLTRAVEDSSSGGTAITLSGTAVVFVTAVAADFGGGDALGTVTGADLDLSTGNFFEVTAANQTLTFSNPPAAHGFTVKVTGNAAVSGYDLSIASYDSVSFSVTGQEGNPQGLAFSTDGTKMFIVGISTDRVFQYTLTTGFDVSTASYDSVSFSISGQEGTSSGLAFNTDGTKMFVVGISTDNVYQYTLTTGFDVSTASYDSVSVSVAGQEVTPNGLAFSPDGVKMFVLGSGTDNVYQYTTGSFTTATITYPASVTFEAGSPPAAPAIGAVKTVDLYTVNGGTNYYDKG
jgi:sugar lactone lactonase YvrE